MKKLFTLSLAALFVAPMLFSSSISETSALWVDSEESTVSSTSGSLGVETASWTASQNLGQDPVPMQTAYSDSSLQTVGNWNTAFSDNERRVGQFVFRNTYGDTHAAAFKGDAVEVTYSGNVNPDEWKWWVFGVYSSYNTCPVRDRPESPELSAHRILASAESLNYGNNKFVGDVGEASYPFWDETTGTDQITRNGWKGVCIVLEANENVTPGQDFRVVVNIDVGHISSNTSRVISANTVIQRGWEQPARGFVDVTT